MAREQRLDPEVEVIWEDFHAEVNVPSAQLRQWLLTRGRARRRSAPTRISTCPSPAGRSWPCCANARWTSPRPTSR